MKMRMHYWIVFVVSWNFVSAVAFDRPSFAVYLNAFDHLTDLGHLHQSLSLNNLIYHESHVSALTDFLDRSHFQNFLYLYCGLVFFDVVSGLFYVSFCFVCFFDSYLILRCCLLPLVP